MIYIRPAKTISTAADGDGLVDSAHNNRPWKEAGQATKTSRLPDRQSALVLHGLQQPYALTSSHPVPAVTRDDELIIKTHTIGHYGFGIPELPYIAGRDVAGLIAQAPTGPSSLKVGDVVLYASTDYRDRRKAAYQEYTIAAQQNICRLPRTVSIYEGAAVGVAFVAAAIILGVNLGICLPRLDSIASIDLLSLVRNLEPESIPPDIREECYRGIPPHERPQAGDWIAIWGGSSTTALFASQIALIAGLQVIMVADTAKHGRRISHTSKGFTWVDSHDPDRAVEVIRGITGNSLRYGVDTVGNKTAKYLQRAFVERSSRKSHLVGLAGLPKERSLDTIYHSVPIKLFHESPDVGSALMGWLEAALVEERLVLPDVTVVEGGLGSVNSALDQMRRGTVSGRRLVVPVY